jgi:threonine aldolase
MAIDLRSDTVTQPTPAMRQAMAHAPVGDDQYGEDPSTNLLQERIGALLGKDAALFVPSGTMANQIALKILTEPGDDVIVGYEAHIVWHESGAAGANSGVHYSEVGEGGLFTAADFLSAFKPADHQVMPPTTLVAIENTHNRGSGIVFPQEDILAICAEAARLGVKKMCDGAQLFNASVASGLSPAELAAPFDAVTVALSKGLGCPVGSLVACSHDRMKRARRARRHFGGAMRQSGILAAAGLYALDHHLARLPEDHVNSRLIAERMALVPGVAIDLTKIQSNIVILSLGEGLPDATAVVARARERGVLVNVFGPRKVRVVTHLNVSQADCERGADILAEVIGRH